MAQPKIGFIGLGNLGSPICERVVAGGHAVTVWNRSVAKTATVGAAGATVAARAAAVARGADIIAVCLTDADAVEAVMFGDNGVASGGGAGKLVVDLSSIDPERTKAIAAKLARECDMAWLDAPVSGGAVGARAGTLAVMAGGGAGDIARATPLFDCFAARISHMGSIGAGQTTKLCNQLIIAVTIAGVAEALNLAHRAGVDATRLPDALAGGWADSAILQDHARRMAAADFSNPGTAAIMNKDIQTVLALGRATTTPLPAASLAASLYQLAIAQGYTDAGQIAPICLYADGPLIPRDAP